MSTRAKAKRTSHSKSRTAKVGLKKGYPSYYRNSTTILSSMIGGAVIGSYISPVIGSITGGIAGAVIGSMNKERHKVERA